MRLFHKNNFILMLATVFIFSCGSRKEIVYVQDIENTKSYQSSKVYEPKLQPDDLLSISVAADSPEIVAPFNLPELKGNDAQNAQLKTYLVDNTGYIDFPVIGKVKLGGLTRTEANYKLVTAISEYINNPTVNLRIINYKVSVLGEVANPDSYTIPNERITILEALSRAGDLTVYGKRENILVIREIEGVKTYNRVDITKAALLDSPFYYLAQNDVIYVEPNQTRINSSKIGPDITVWFTAISLLLTITTVLLVR